MKRVLVLVEGQTEEVFANELLAPHLLLFDVHLAPVVVATKRPRWRSEGGGRDQFLDAGPKRGAAPPR